MEIRQDVAFLTNSQLALRTRWCSAAAMSESPEAASVAREIAASYPSLPAFLVVAGVSSESKAAVLARVTTLEALKEIKTESGRRMKIRVTFHPNLLHFVATQVNGSNLSYLLLLISFNSWRQFESRKIWEHTT